MFRVTLVVFATLASSAALRAEEPPRRLNYPDDRRQAQEDLAKLQGSWVRVLGENDGRRSTAPDSWTATYEGDRLTLKSGGEHYRTGLVTLDATRTPRAMNTWDVDGPNKDAVFPGIYELDGDKLKVCFAHPGEKRPTEFKADGSAGGGFVFYVYERRKP